MAIKTVATATPLSIREPVLIAFTAIAVVTNIILNWCEDHFGYTDLLSAVTSGALIGQFFLATILAGLSGRHWLAAYSTGLALVVACIGGLTLRDGIRNSEFVDLVVIAPLALLSAASPAIALRQLFGLRLAKDSDVPYTRSRLQIGNTFTAMAFTAALLIFARVGLLTSFQEQDDYWITLSWLVAIGFGLGALTVAPAVLCVFSIESRWRAAAGLIGLFIFPLLVCLIVVVFVVPEDLSASDRVEGLIHCFVICAVGTIFVVPLLLLLRSRGFRLLRILVKDLSSDWYRDASFWMICAIVALAVGINALISPIEQRRERKRQFERWVSEIGGTAEEKAIGTWELELANSRVTDGGLTSQIEGMQIVRLDLAGTKVTDDLMEAVGRLSSLKYLNLSNTEITDQGLKQLRNLPNLEVLLLAGTRVAGVPFANFHSSGALVTLDLTGASVSDEGCAGLAHLTSLQTLQLSRTSISDEGLQHLGYLAALQQLHLVDTTIQGDGFAGFGEMPDLAVVLLNDSNCGDGVANLVSNSPRLIVLKLSGTKVTDAFMSSLREHSNLSELYLANTSITDVGIKGLGAIPHLRLLQLDHTKVTGDSFRHITARELEEIWLDVTLVNDAAIEHLKRFPRLQVIHLRDTSVGDDALPHLAGRNIGELDLTGTRVTAQGLLSAHFAAYQLIIDDSQADASERLELRAMFETVKVTPADGVAVE